MSKKRKSKKEIETIKDVKISEYQRKDNTQRRKENTYTDSKKKNGFEITIFIIFFHFFTFA